MHYVVICLQVIPVQVDITAPEVPLHKLHALQATTAQIHLSRLGAQQVTTVPFLACQLRHLVHMEAIARLTEC